MPGTHQHTHTQSESRESFMAEGLFTLSIRSRCELGGRGDKNRVREVRETERETGRKDRETEAKSQKMLEY